jgi:hypothetical protein
MKSDRINAICEKLKINRNKALHITRKLENTSDIFEKLDIMDLLDSLEELPNDSGVSELREYQEAKETFKRLYTLSARGIIQILSTDFMFGRNDPTSSFNYSEPEAPLKAVKKIGFLPKAYRGGPIKAAMNSPYLKVNKKAVEFYDDLPHDLKFSETFLEAVRKKIRIIRSMKAA